MQGFRSQCLRRRTGGTRRTLQETSLHDNVSVRLEMDSDSARHILFAQGTRRTQTHRKTMLGNATVDTRETSICESSGHQEQHCRSLYETSGRIANSRTPHEPSSLDFVTRGVQNLQISNSPAPPAALPAPPPPTMKNARRPPKSKQMRRQVCTVWSRSRRSHGVHRRRSHAACGAAASRQCGGTALASSRGLCSLRDHQVAAMSPMQPLRKRHSSP